MSVNLPKLFDYVKNILNGRTKLPVKNKNYQQYVINRALSSHPDLILLVSEIENKVLTNQQHYDLLFAIVPKRYREFKKWMKDEENEAELKVCKIFNVNKTEANQIVQILSEDELISIIDQYEKETNNDRH